MTMFRLMLIAAVAVLSASPAPAADDTLTIGFTVSQTGKLNNDSIAQMRGFELWRDEVNAGGGIKAGDKTYKVNFVNYDDESAEWARTAALHPHYQSGQGPFPVQPVLLRPGGDRRDRVRAVRQDHADHGRRRGEDLQARQ